MLKNNECQQPKHLKTMSENMFIRLAILTIGLTTVSPFDVEIIDGKIFAVTGKDTTNSEANFYDEDLTFEEKENCISYLTKDIDTILKKFNASKKKVS